MTWCTLEKKKTENHKRNNNVEQNRIKAAWDLFKEDLPSFMPNDMENNVERLNEFIVLNLIKATNKAVPIIVPKT
jgi:hypothetical protein